MSTRSFHHADTSRPAGRLATAPSDPSEPPAYPGHPFAFVPRDLADRHDLDALRALARESQVDLWLVVRLEWDGAPEELATGAAGWLAAKWEAVLRRHALWADPVGGPVEGPVPSVDRLRAGFELTLFYAEHLVGLLEGENARRTARAQLEQFARDAGLAWKAGVAR